MPEIASNSVPCCVTDIGTGRIWWEWRQGHWVIAENLPLRQTEAPRVAQSTLASRTCFCASEVAAES